MKVELICHTPEPEKVVAAAAKLCYSKSPASGIMQNLDEEKTRSFIKMLMSMGHASPIEHVSFTFSIEGVSRSLLAQITRHRIASYSVKSQRYVAEDGFEFVIPPKIEETKEAKAIFLRAMERDREDYIALSKLLERKHLDMMLAAGMGEAEAKIAAQKRAIEDARYVLPNACETKMVVTMNARSLENFFSLRCCERAQWEIRRLADEMLRLVKAVAPTLFAASGPPCVSGPCPEGKMSCGKAEQKRNEYRGDKF
ncbi:MAG: FAD-dependent thymidylate synthase [Clostridia bacterium]|nr:FAD-dependent thymidylate synthase [Clostridia bacterium]